eukprot:scaffold66196_cov14-Tisochrysis_lutea.AAC.1
MCCLQGPLGAQPCLAAAAAVHAVSLAAGAGWSLPAAAAMRFLRRTFYEAEVLARSAVPAALLARAAHAAAALFWGMPAAGVAAAAAVLGAAPSLSTPLMSPAPGAGAAAANPHEP